MIVGKPQSLAYGDRVDALEAKLAFSTSDLTNFVF